MSLRNMISFNRHNGRLILVLIAGHLLWSGTVMGLWATGQQIVTPTPWWTACFIALQLYLAAQLLLPALLLHPENRSRGFYIAWGVALAVLVWLTNQLPAAGSWQPLLEACEAGLLLLTATVIGAALARYVNRLWEILPVCVVITLADFSSWLLGPTANFAREIEQYYLAPEGPPPLIDVILVKLAVPGAPGLVPVFGISDWIMVAFFSCVAGRYRLNDNLLGTCGEMLAQRKLIGGYLPVPLAALFAAILLARTSGLFIPALPVIAAVMLAWHAGRYLLEQLRERWP